MIDDKLYYEGRDGDGDSVNVLIEDTHGGVYALSTLENRTGGTSFARAIEMFELSRLGARPKVQNQPIAKPDVTTVS